VDLAAGQQTRKAARGVADVGSIQMPSSRRGALHGKRLVIGHAGSVPPDSSITPVHDRP